MAHLQPITPAKDFFRLRLSLEGWPVRQWELADQSGTISQVISIKPSNFSWEAGVAFEPRFDAGSLRAFASSLSLRWHGSTDFGFLWRIGVKLFDSPRFPLVSVRVGTPFSKTTSPSMAELGIELSWAIVNARWFRGGLSFSYNFASLSRHASFENGFAAGFHVSFGRPMGTRAIPAFVEVAPSPRLFREVRHLWKREDLGLPPLPNGPRPGEVTLSAKEEAFWEELNARNGKPPPPPPVPRAGRIAIFVDEPFWKKLMAEHSSLFRRYLASIAQDYAEEERMAISFEVIVGNWSESAEGDPLMQIEQVKRIHAAIRRMVREETNEEIFFGSLMFGAVPYALARSDIDSQQDFGGPSDIFYRFPCLDVKAGDGHDGTALVKKEEDESLSRCQMWPVGRFPDAQPGGGSDEMAFAVRLMENAIAYRKGAEPDGSEERSSEVVAYLSESNRMGREAREVLSEIRRAGDPLVRPPGSFRGETPETPNDKVRFIDPQGKDFIAERRAELLKALKGGAEQPPAHAVVFSDHGNEDSVRITDFVRGGSEWIRAWASKQLSGIFPEDFGERTPTPNFLVLRSCHTGQSAEKPWGLINAMVRNGGFVGTFAHMGLGRSEDASSLLFEFAGGKFRPGRFWQRMSPSDIHRYLGRDGGAALTLVYFGDPFVRIVPLAYKKPRPPSGNAP